MFCYKAQKKFFFFFSVEWQNYLRTQAGNTTTVNVVICTVDYLLRLQVYKYDSILKIN